ncbi:MAG: hypothetical protein HYT98_00185 [Candidatus Sungbacteria bacterium]|nr:hypothetical protein [Candidatus Sungbacteria bacterium]
MVDKEYREQLFAEAIAQHRNSLFPKERAAALQNAQRCLELLKGVQSISDAATSRVSITVNRYTVLLPEYLHFDTAGEHFRAAGIRI